MVCHFFSNKDTELITCFSGIKYGFSCNFIVFINGNIDDLNVNFDNTKLTKLTTPVAEATVSIQPDLPQLQLKR